MAEAYLVKSHPSHTLVNRCSVLTYRQDKNNDNSLCTVQIQSTSVNYHGAFKNTRIAEERILIFYDHRFFLLSVFILQIYLHVNYLDWKLNLFWTHTVYSTSNITMYQLSKLQSDFLHWLHWFAQHFHLGAPQHNLGAGAWMFLLVQITSHRKINCICLNKKKQSQKELIFISDLLNISHTDATNDGV